MSAQIIDRLNQFDGTAYVLSCENGVPQCPHCGAPMAQVQVADRGDWRWENATCKCWWVGMQDGVYPLQVAIAATAEEEFAYRTRREEERRANEQRREEELFRARLDYAAGDASARFLIIQNLRYLFGKKCKKDRFRVRSAIQAGADFDQAMNA